jgi:hypothetical protein
VVQLILLSIYVISGAQLTGKYYKIMQDNYYQTVALAVLIRDNRNVLCACTAHKKHIDNNGIIEFGGAKRPKPSHRYPN